MVVPIQLVIYTNDAVDIAFSDDSRLQLTACGSSFVHLQTSGADAHPLHGLARIEQRTAFVTSTYREKLQQAIDFRNRFAECPYLSLCLINRTAILRLHADIFEVGWPTIITAERLTGLPDGSLKLSSLDDYATITLASSQQHFTVQFLAKISQPKDKVSRKKVSENLVREAGEKCKGNSDLQVDDLSDEVASILEGQGFDYCWVTQHHSVNDCPHHWRHPVKLICDHAKQSKQKRAAFTTEEDSKSDISESATEKETTVAPLTKLKMLYEKNCTFGSLPQSLPLNCQAPHLHRRTKGAVMNQKEDAYIQGRVKVVCLQGIVYKLIWNQPQGVEICPGDGSVLRSTGLAGHYFTHYIQTKTNVEERMYSVKCLPPHVPGSSYNVAQLIERGIRFLQVLQDEKLNLIGADDLCCWKVKNSFLQEPMPTILLEECKVPSVGHFRAYSSGSVRVVFTDRHSLDMQADFSKRLENCQQHSKFHNRKSGGAQLQASPGLLHSTCRLLLPSGHYHVVELSNPEGYGRYVQAALEWVNWVNCSPDDRSSFYKNTLYDPECRDDVRKELKKINCFNYIIEHTVLPQFNPPEEFFLVSAQKMLHEDTHPTLTDTVLHDRTSSHLTNQTLSSEHDHLNHTSDKVTGGFTTADSSALANMPGSASSMFLNNTGKYSWGADPGCGDFVGDTLRKTANQIRDLDSFLLSSRPSKMATNQRTS